MAIGEEEIIMEMIKDGEFDNGLTLDEAYIIYLDTRIRMEGEFE